MPELTTPRWRFARDAFLRPAGAVVAIPYTVWGLLAFVRDEIVQPSNTALWKPFFWLSKLPWYIWLVATLVVAMVVLFEGAYRTVRSRETVIAGLLTQIEQLSMVRPLLIVEFLQEPMSGSDPYTKGIFGSAPPRATRTSDILRIVNVGNETATTVTIDLGEKLPSKWCIFDKEIPILMPNERFETKVFVSQLVQAMGRAIVKDELRLPVYVRYVSYHNGSRAQWLTVCAIVLKGWDVTMEVVSETDRREWTTLPAELDVIGFS